MSLFRLKKTTSYMHEFCASRSQRYFTCAFSEAPSPIKFFFTYECRTSCSTLYHPILNAQRAFYDAKTELLFEIRGTYIEGLKYDMIKHFTVDKIRVYTRIFTNGYN